MCTSPIRIVNNTLHYNRDYHPYYYIVPCCQCEECRKSKRSEWFVRCFYHWKETMSKGGCSYFGTLTFDDDHLPFYEVYGAKVKCFDKKIVQDFIKRFRDHLKRHYGLEMSYLIVSEFGELYHRPHHHFQFNFSGKISSFDLYALLKETWKQGFVHLGKNGGLLNSPAGILYTTKYITKDSAFEEFDDLIFHAVFVKYRDIYDAFVSENSLDAPIWDKVCKNPYQHQEQPYYEIYLDFMREYHRHTPFNVHSNKLGYDIINKLSSAELRDDCVLMPQNGEFVEVPLPRYIKRHLYFDRVPNERDGKRNKFVINQRGRDHLLDTLEKKIMDKGATFYSFFSTHQVTDVEIPERLRHIYTSATELNGLLRYYAQNVDFKRMAIYSVIYRYRPYNCCPFDPFNNYTKYVRMVNCLLENKKDIPLSFYSHEDRDKFIKSLSNYANVFQPYEVLCDLYDSLSCTRKKSTSSFQKNKETLQRKTRDVLIKSTLK